jgi:hypothetical protein
LEHGTTGRRGRVEGLLMQIEIASRTSEFLNEADQVLERSAEVVNRPNRNDINLAAHDRL